jgi:hypothetical protein
MGLIEGVSLFDVANCEAFIQRALDKSGVRYNEDEREELLAEGWAVFYALACGYKPLPEPPCGYSKWFAMGLDDRQAYELRLHSDLVKRGRFSGHVAMFFPRRFGDAWHKAHPEHRYITDPETGKRGWRYGLAPVSLDSITDADDQDVTGLGRRYGGDNELLHARTISAFCHVATIALLGRTSPRPA